MESPIKGYFVFLERKKSGDIFLSPVVEYKKEMGQEYLKKIRYYLPQMLPLLNKETTPEEYPRRPLYSFNSPCGMCDYALLCIYGDISGYDFTEKKVYPKPYISPTALIQFDVCPRQWAYHAYGVKSTQRSAAIVLGEAVHGAIEAYLKMAKECEETFTQIWDAYREAALKYPQKADFLQYREIGVQLCRRFPAFWQHTSQRIGVKEIEVEAQRRVRYDSFILSGKMDLLCSVDRGLTILDWKLTNRKYDDAWLLLSEQMTSYFLLLDGEGVDNTEDSEIIRDQ